MPGRTSSDLAPLFRRAMSESPARYRPTDDPFYQPGPPPEAAAAPPGPVVSDDTRRPDRIPPGQVRTKKWPVLHAGRVPDVRPETWSLTVGGCVARPTRFDWSSFQSLTRTQVFADFHCVTRWSRLGNLWEGVSGRTIAELVRPTAAARFVIAEGSDDGWTTNLPLDEFLGADVLLADRHDGRPLTAEHGGPVRLIVPRLYAWKSAKWLRSLTFVETDEPGYWERLGYHDRGDPWGGSTHDGERFRDGGPIVERTGRLPNGMPGA